MTGRLMATPSMEDAEGLREDREEDCFPGDGGSEKPEDRRLPLSPGKQDMQPQRSGATRNQTSPRRVTGVDRRQGRRSPEEHVGWEGQRSALEPGGPQCLRGPRRVRGAGGQDHVARQPGAGAGGLAFGRPGRAAAARVLATLSDAAERPGGASTHQRPLSVAVATPGDGSQGCKSPVN